MICVEKRFIGGIDLALHALTLHCSIIMFKGMNVKKENKAPKILYLNFVLFEIIDLVVKRALY